VIVDLINEDDWSSMGTGRKGYANEGWLTKNAQHTKPGAGHYLTPRPLVRVMA
jgi:type I restriction enzyme M protein